MSWEIFEILARELARTCTLSFKPNRKYDRKEHAQSRFHTSQKLAYDNAYSYNSTDVYFFRVHELLLSAMFYSNFSETSQMPIYDRHAAAFMGYSVVHGD